MGGEKQIVESLSWRLVTELWRRFPDRFTLFETHPGGGQYDCLTLRDRIGDLDGFVDVNREGSVHVRSTLPGSARSWSDWIDRMLGGSPVVFLDELTEALGLEPPKRLQGSTATTIVHRFVSEFLTHAIGRVETWECRNGFYDTSGCGGGKREDWFAQFPIITQQVEPQRHKVLPATSAYSYWFLVKNGDPMLCLNTDGLAFSRAGNEHELLHLYRQRKRIWPLITTVAGDLLP